MDTGIARIRRSVMVYHLGDARGQQQGARAKSRRRKELYRYFKDCCDRYTGLYVWQLKGDWAQVELDPDPLSLRVALVLKSLGRTPQDFGIRRIRMGDPEWMDQFAEQLGMVPLISGDTSGMGGDWHIEYFVLCWLVCVERSNALLQQGIRRAMAMDNARQMDVMQYLAAAAVLLLRNTELNWPKAVFAFRQEILKIVDDPKMPSATRSWPGSQEDDRQYVLDKLTDEVLLQAFAALKENTVQEENALPALVDGKDARLLRELALLPNAKNNDYLYLMRGYLDKLDPAHKIRSYTVQEVMDLAATFFRLLEQKGDQGKQSPAESKDRAAQTTQKKEDVVAEWYNVLGASPEDEGGNRRGIKISFRMLRHTLYLLLGLTQDAYYGKERDIRELVFRLAFACGMDREEMEKLLCEQEMPGIDFKTAPELLYAYCSDRWHIEPAPDQEGTELRVNREAYSTACLALRVYTMTRPKGESNHDGKPTTLEATRYVREGYREKHNWTMPPQAFLKWMDERQIPAQDYETLLAETLLADPEDPRPLLLFCGQLFRARRAVQRINSAALEQQYLTWEKGEDYQAEKEKLQQEAEQMDTILKRVNSAGTLFTLREGEKEMTSTNVLQQAVELSAWCLDYASTFFPYDGDEREYASYYLSNLGELESVKNYWETYTRNKLKNICRYINENRMLSRDDYLCLLFTEYLVDYARNHGRKEPQPDEACVNTFAQESEPELRESRMEAFHPQAEPQMTRAFLEAIRQYLEHTRTTA